MGIGRDQRSCYDVGGSETRSKANALLTKTSHNPFGTNYQTATNTPPASNAMSTSPAVKNIIAALWTPDNGKSFQAKYESALICRNFKGTYVHNLMANNSGAEKAQKVSDVNDYTMSKHQPI